MINHLSNSNQVKIREAIAKDAEALTRLSEQLGYPTTPAAIRQHLEQMPAEQNVVYVAECSNAGVVGWIHVHLVQLVQADLHAEIGGLVVDDNYRGGGVGRRLVQQIEEWSSKRGCKSVYVRSNAIRKQAHVFYQKIGYSHIKTSLALRKDL